MMLPILILLFAFPDIKRIPVENEFIKEFYVTESIDDSTTDCSENPSGGGPLDTLLKTEHDERPMPFDNGIVQEFAAESRRDEPSIFVAPRFSPSRPKPSPEPDPLLEPPQVVTPEPPTALILFTSAILLLLLFGLRQKKLTR